MDEPKWLTEGPSYEALCGPVRERKSRIGLRQKCVTYPPKPWGNTVIYEDTSTHIDVA